MVNCSVQSNYRIELFHSRRHQLYEFIATTEEFNSHRIGLGHKHGRRFIVLGHQYGGHYVMWTTRHFRNEEKTGPT